MAYSEATLNPPDLEMDSEQSPQYSEMIATVISSLKEDAAYENHEQGYTWKFTYGTVEVFVHLSGETPDDTLAVWSTVMSYPVKDEARLLKLLLSKNWIETLEARFCFWNDQIVLNHYRTLEGLTAAEISRAITIVATLADELDEPLIEEFGMQS